MQYITYKYIKKVGFLLHLLSFNLNLKNYHFSMLFKVNGKISYYFINKRIVEDYKNRETLILY